MFIFAEVEFYAIKNILLYTLFYYKEYFTTLCV